MSVETAEETVEVRYAAVCVIEVELLDQRGRQAVAAAAIPAQPDPGRRKAVERRPKPHLHCSQGSAVGRVDCNHVEAVELCEVGIAVYAVDHPILEAKACITGDGFKALEFARLDWRRRHEQQTFGLHGLGLDAHRQAQRQEAEDEHHCCSSEQ